jgi:uncharacterized protein (TIGR03663 family)
MSARMAVVVLVVAVAAGALAARLPGLGKRPLHQDESINADKFSELWRTGRFVYDPHEYHGPTLWYLTLPAVWASGANTYPEMTEAHFRVVPVVFSVGLILLLLLLHDALRPAELAAAAVLLAVSPAFAFYARYYIHEMPLVFFTALAIGCGWRYARTGQAGWCVLCGVALALMHATKETWIIAVFAMVAALGVTVAWARWVERRPVSLRRLWDWRILTAIGVGTVVAAVLFSSFFTNPRGPLDAVLTYRNYLQRGAGAGDHDHSFGWYLKLLAWYHAGGRYPVRTELFILVMAGAGAVVALWPGRRSTRPQGFEVIAVERSGGADPGVAAATVEPPGRAAFLRFLAVYTLVATLVYCAIRYKTPWCALTFLHGMILLAGVAVGFLVRLMPHMALKGVVAGVILAPVAHLGWQAWEINHDAKQVASNRYNPYVYSQPTTKFFELVERMRGLAAASPDGKGMKVHVVTQDCWPLPFYVRDFTDVNYPPLTPMSRRAAVVIGSEVQQPELEQLLNGDEESADDDRYMWESQSLRPGVVLVVYIEKSLWDAYMKTRMRRP